MMWFSGRVSEVVAVPSGLGRGSGRRSWRDQPGTGAALALASVAALTVAFGLIADAAGLGLGTLNPPFFVSWDPLIEARALPWIAVLAGCGALAIPLQRSAPGAVSFMLGALALAVIARLALAAVRDGTSSWYAVFGLDPEAANEYLPALSALDLGTATFLDRFAELAPSLPIHPSAHPPGLLLTLDWLGIDDPRGMAALVIGFGTLAVPLTYLTARRLQFEEGQARIAAILLALSPGAMLYGATSPDAMFMTLGLIAAILLIGGGWASRIAGMVALAVASFFSFALLALGAFSAIVVLLREGLSKAFWVAAGAGVALLVFYGGLYALYGYDTLGFLSAAHEAYELGISTVRPWAFWALGSPVAFFVALGLPISWYAARALGSGAEVAVALAAIVLVAAVLGFSKAETERIWLFMAPLACLAAARMLPREKMPYVIPILLAQGLAAELLLETVW